MAVYEDIFAFVIRILKTGPTTPEEIFDVLTEDFSITADKQMVADICADLLRRVGAEMKDQKIQIPG